MKSLLIGLLSLAMLPSVALAQGAVANPSDLMVVPTVGEVSLRSLHDAGLTVVHQMKGFYLVAGRRADLERAGASTEQVVALRGPGAGQAYYTVGVRSPERIDEVADHATLLYTAGHELVVAATEEQISQVAGLGYEVARVFNRPLRMPRTDKDSPVQRDKAFDQLVADIVAAVDSPSIDAHVQRLQDFGTRYTTHDSCGAAALYILNELRDYGLSARYQQFSTSYAPNVVGELTGVSEPEKIIVIGGHYDSTSTNNDDAPGADDNASGTACMLECARVMAGHQFDYTVHFLAFGAEEIGLIGSEAYAAELQTAGEDVVAVLNIDMIGYLAAGDVMDLDVVDNASSLWLRNLAFEVAAEYVPGLPLVDGSLPFGASSDHASFWSHGYDAIMLFEDSGNYSPYIHTPNDLVGLSYNSPELAEMGTQVVVATLATLARPYRLAIVHEPLGDATDALLPFDVTATITAAGVLDAGSLQLYWSAGAGYTATPLIATGEPDTYAAEIPVQTAGTFVSYYLAAGDTEAYVATHPTGAPESVHSFFVGSTYAALEHDFESDTGWTVGATGDDATTGIWVRADPNGIYDATVAVQPENDATPDPGVMCFITGNDAAGSSQGANDVDGGQTTLLSPVFDLADYTHVWVDYRRWYSNDTGANPGEDLWRVEVTGDGGVNWDEVELTSSSDRSWRQVHVYLPDVTTLTDQMQFRFVAADEGSGSVVEAGLDDFAIVVFDGLSPVNDPAGMPQPVILGAAIPNPFNPRTTINFRVPDEGRRVTLALYDLSGRRVTTLLQDEVVHGARAVVWDGTDNRGQRAAAGVYLYRLQAGRDVLSRKLTLVK